MSGPLLLLIYVIASLPVVLVFKWWYTLSSRLPYPPGPKPSLIAGNSAGVATTLPWLKYTEWAKQYGDIVHFRIFNEHVVVVNTVKDAIAMFDKRSRIYSDRPEMIMIELMGWDFNASLIRYGDKWRRHRRLFQQNFNKATVQITQEPTQTVKVYECLNRLLVAPDDFIAHFRTVTAAIVMATVYDNKISEAEVERFAGLAETAVTKLSESFFPGAVSVNALPFLRHLPTWFPGAGFHKLAAECKVCTDEMQNYPFRHVQEKMASGDEVSGLLARLLQRKTDNPEWAHEEADIKGVAATSFVGGAETTVSAIETFLYAMVVSYEAQKKAQDEIDSIVGNKRLPDFSDRESMPYLEAVFREVMRWHPVTPLGVSHAPSEDDIYKGYFIPKGATIMPNIWAMTHDETRYPQPDLFLPERFFNENGKLNDDDTVLSFGFGRRWAESALETNA
ncbi:hypothetical protein DXG01_016147 [Tephrocybe rancida]|nr:hypothetical protein DXG01_016147 [Tephrocybe rancida]